jgi:hypothetical protein
MHRETRGSSGGSSWYSARDFPPFVVIDPEAGGSVRTTGSTLSSPIDDPGLWVVPGRKLTDLTA